MAEVRAKKPLPIPRPRKTGPSPRPGGPSASAAARPPAKPPKLPKPPRAGPQPGPARPSAEARAAPEAVEKPTARPPPHQARPGASTPPEGRSFAGRYVLDRMLGRGSMGSVWLAEDERLGRRVAVKILGSMWAESDDARKRFEREAKAVAKLHSPHIVQVFDYGIEDGRPYIVMELLDGEDLHSRLKRKGRLSLHETASVVLQACRALHVAHKAGVVHRDLKPGNLMVDHSTGDDLVKVLDFGVAKARTDQDTESTKAGTLLGTPQYMAPEQARALPDVDHQADLWAIGVIAYRALTGQAPFRAKSVTDMIVQICTTKPAPVSSLRPELPPLADVFFSRALAHDRDKRFGTARELASSFYRLIDSSAPSMSLSVFDSGRMPALGTEEAPASFPGADSWPSQPAAGDELSSTNLTVSSSSPEASQPSQAGNAAACVGEGLPVDTLSSAADALVAGAAAAEPRASKSFGTGAAVVAEVPISRGRGRLLVGLSAAAAALLVAAWLLLDRGGVRSGVLGASTAGAAAERTSPGPTVTGPAAPSAARPAPEPTASAVATTSAGAGAAASASAAPTATTPHPWRPPVRHTTPPPTPTAPPPRPQEPDSSDLLGERY